MYPVWCIVNDPTQIFLTASYSGDLATALCMKSRYIIQSELFRYYFPHITIKKDNNQKTQYEFDNGGARIATSVGGTVTGKHAHQIIIDDPVSAAQSHSEKDTETANTWLDETLPTRKVDKKLTPTIYIMQRLSENDPSAHLLNKKGLNLRHICLPAELSDDVKPPEAANFYVNGLLDNNRLDKSALQDLLYSLGPYGYSGQMSQRPSPIGGGSYKFEWFRKINLSELQKNTAFRSCPKIAYIDGAEGKTANADYTAIACCYFLPVTRYNDLNRRNETVYEVYIRNISRCKLDTANAPAFIHATMEKYLPKSPLKIEAKSAGISYLESMKTNYSYRTFAYEYPPHSNIKQTTPKYTRIMNAMPYVFQGNVFLVNDDLQNDNQWHTDFENEVNSFPKGQHDDQLDCVTNAIFDAMYGQVFVGGQDFSAYF
jgi:predicted phage terminase large subunit-like protein